MYLKEGIVVIRPRSHIFIINYKVRKVKTKGTHTNDTKTYITIRILDPTIWLYYQIRN